VGLTLALVVWGFFCQGCAALPKLPAVGMTAAADFRLRCARRLLA
jgi:hypothetical protein